MINQKDFIDKILSLNIVSKDYVYSNEVNANRLVADSFGKLFCLDPKFQDLLICKKIVKSMS